MNSQSICNMSRVNHVLSPSKGANSDTGYMVKFIPTESRKTGKPLILKDWKFLSSCHKHWYKLSVFIRWLVENTFKINSQLLELTHHPAAWGMLPFCRWIMSSSCIMLTEKTCVELRGFHLFVQSRKSVSLQSRFGKESSFQRMALFKIKYTV